MRPIRSIGWRTVVSGGSVQFISAESSKPTTDTSSGTFSPARRTARIAPRAIGSLAHTMPVMPRASSRVAAAWAASREYSEWAMWSAPEREPGLGRERPRARDLAPRRHVVARTDEQADVGVAERDQVAHRLFDGDRVVARDAREAQPVDRRR